MLALEALCIPVVKEKFLHFNFFSLPMMARKSTTILRDFFWAGLRACSNHNGLVTSIKRPNC